MTTPEIPQHTLMFFVCHPKVLHKLCLQFLLGVKIAPRETENNAYAKFGVTNKEHYGMLWYFLEWSIQHKIPEISYAISNGTDKFRFGPTGIFGSSFDGGPA